MDRITGYSLFRGISDADCSKLLTCLRAKVRWYSAGQRLFPSIIEADQVGMITEGEAVVVRIDVHGGETKLETLRPGGVFGAVSAFGGLQMENVEVRAATQCQVLYLHRDQITKRCGHACEYHSRLMANFLRILARQTVDLSRRLELLSRRTIREKLLAYLEQEASRQETRRFRIPVPQKDLAQILCVDRSAMWRELRAMKNNGLLDFEGRDFELKY